MGMRQFAMIRRGDESGVSGTGLVLHGVVFDEGECVVRWRGDKGSVNVYRSYANFVDVHVKSHPTNGTRIEFEDGAVEEY